MAGFRRPPPARGTQNGAGAEISSGGGDRRNWVPPQRPTPYVVLTCGETEVARWALDGAHDPDLSVVDLLARLHLAARRLGYSIRLSDPPGPLLALIDLAGLAGVIVATTAPATTGRAAPGGPGGTVGPAGTVEGAVPAGAGEDSARDGSAQDGSAQDLAPVEVDGGGGEDRDQPDRPDQHG
jgi:hypothetical protein